MQYPRDLTPNTTENIKLPSGVTVQIPKITSVFEIWSGKSVADTYNNKPILNYKDEPVFAELAILRILQSDKWNGVWVDTYRNAYRTSYFPKDSVKLPSEQAQLLQSIYKKAGANKGCWDVFCWRGQVNLFAEAKRQGHDKIRYTQKHWLESAIQCGLPLTSFLVVEWSQKLP